MLKPDAEGVLPGDFVASFEKDDLRLGLLGLNSTFLQLERGISAEMQMLAVDAEQIQAAADGDLTRWAKGHDAFLLLTHQPLSWLREGSVKALERHVINPLTPALHLYGHMHVPDFRRESRGGNPEKRRLQGAALFGLERRGQEDEDRVHGYSACRLEMDDEKACIRVWPRRIVEREGWDFEPDQDYKLMRDHRGRRDEIQPVPVTLYEGRVRRSRRRTHQRPQARPADTPDESSPLAVRERDAAERLRAEISRGGFHGYTSEKSDGLREIIRALSQLYAEDRLGSLPEGERVLTLEDLVESGRRLGLRSDPEWSPFLDYCALDAAVVRVDRGEFRRARAAAREVLDLRGAHSAHGQRALEILCEAAYAAGDRNAAIDWLELWFQVPPERRTNDAFFKQARRYPRWRGNLAVRRLDEDLERYAGSDRDRLLIELQRAEALCYSDDADLAPEAVAAVERMAQELGISDPGFMVKLHHTAYIAAHNLERNEDAVRRAKACITLYDAPGAREEYLLSRINLGDALWGQGCLPEAIAILEDAHQEAKNAVFERPRALAPVCLANVIVASATPRSAPASAAALDRAEALYEEGIAKSKSAYDELYGRIYLALLRAERGGRDGTELRELAELAREEHLAYLADMACGYAALRDAQTDTHQRVAPHSETRELIWRDGAAPLAGVHAAAAVLARTGRQRTPAKHVLVGSLDWVQGLKGRPDVVATVAHDAAGNDREREIAARFPPRC